LAAQNNHVDKLKELWACAEETQLKAKEMKKKFFLVENKYGLIAWHRAASKGCLEVLETLWDLAKEEELSIDEL
jgi:hypothetical protein